MRSFSLQLYVRLCTINVESYMLEFVWDIDKEKGNISKHGLSFMDAIKVFFTKFYEERSDRYGEPRYLAIAEVENRVLVVVYTIRNNQYRIISARRARKNEKEIYRKHCKLSH